VATVQRQGFNLVCDDALTAQGEWLADAVERHAEIWIGATIEVGWSVFKLLEQNGQLVLCEPDFDKDPFSVFRCDVSESLKTLVTQNGFLDGVKAKPCQVRFDDKVIFKKGCLSAPNLYGERSSPSRGDSGWYFGPVEGGTPISPEELEAVFAYQLASMRPELIKVLSLPAGWLVLFNGPLLTKVVNEQNMEVGRYDA
jgi:hypothetical protein